MSEKKNKSPSLEKLVCKIDSETGSLICDVSAEQDRAIRHAELPIDKLVFKIKEVEHTPVEKKIKASSVFPD